MPDEYPTPLHRWFEQVWNQGRTETIHEMMSDETVHHGVSGPGGAPMKGIKPFLEFHKVLRSAFEDLHFKLEDVVTEGNKIAARYTATGKQVGPLPDFPEVTGKHVKFTGGGVCTMEDGKFVEVWNEIDFQKMLHDLNAPPIDK